ncbi:glycosyltransferase [Engelhardtia mirabilis]|uniref:GDP-mannose-dependent alpha-(1-6)-phosphatidylinositol monomannoside mannosyltransferase n=1 Tax=Engelhardtia mirabilis TaxID=2528011 RepID=A0A518BDX2_9BACT|nr:GDP-mannose-dependent alpha-(1-6)-phosphatidylinositol monomannoside mannosyltransferase [Planctomycetes bacterium Pla133]QDU99409.1 GDP-mannose-dependent alpha-(1-6)-phosphatidylinositol monomannoside mannosyltransferase [Planctomycetes bacterium Pla86]
MNDLRVGYLLKKFPRLSETFVLGEILAQEALGTDIVVFSRRAPDDEPRHPELDQLRAEVVVLPHPREADPFAILIADGASGELLARLGEALEELRPLDHPRLGSIVTEALVLLSECRERGIGHLHAHFATDSALLAHLVQRLGGPSYSITAHAKDIYREGTDPAFLNQLFAHSAFTITVCDANVAHLESILSSTALERVRRHYNGIERAAFESVVRRPAGARLLSIGRLVEKKGFDVLIDALHLLAARGLEFDARLVGEGEERAVLEARAASGPAAERIRFLGPLPADAVRLELEQARVFALACKTGNDGNKDALPTVLLEAQAAGVPMISTPVAGVTEILDQGRCGVLVPEGDAAALADALTELLENPDRGELLASRGRELGARLFDREVQGRILRDWFRAALAASALASTDAREVSCASPT